MWSRTSVNCGKYVKMHPYPVKLDANRKHTKLKVTEHQKTDIIYEQPLCNHSEIV